MVQNKALQMMLSAQPIMFCLEASWSNFHKVKHIFESLAKDDQENLIKGNSYSIASFNQLARDLVNLSIELNTVDRYRRTITSNIRAKRERENAQLTNTVSSENVA